MKKLDLSPRSTPTDLMSLLALSSFEKDNDNGSTLVIWALQ